MICRKRKLVFIHIPKAGGSSIEDMLWPRPRATADLWGGFVRPGFNKYQSGGLQHLTAQQIRQEVGDAVFDSCFVFAVVRDPINRLVSQFNYLNRRQDLRDLLGLDQARDFSTYLERIQEFEHVQWKRQIDFVVSENGEMLPEIYHLERLKDDFGRLAVKLGLPRDAPLVHANASVPSSIPEGWVTIRPDELTQEHRTTIYRVYRDDFEQFGYETSVP